ncbi:MAG: hypothetical protein JSR74_11160 [Proteobacteria bacterium]|nr:hypothetical protein [Pseudomonadota bacterium]
MSSILESARADCLFPATCEERASAPVRVAAIAFAPQLGDVEENILTMHLLARDAIEHGARIVVFPELATSGYSIELTPLPNTVAIAQPFDELSALVGLAIQHSSLIVAGFAERDGERLYNSAVVIEPSGKINVQRKRWSFPGSWQQPGSTPIEVYSTPWGTVAVVICSDTYNMESARIAALKGADILLVPANWWGPFEQLSLWKTRARENGVWLIVANRLGRERVAFSAQNSVQDMRGPSAIISPSGHIAQVYEPDLSVTECDDVVLYQTIDSAARRDLAKLILPAVIRRSYDGLGSVNYLPPHFSPPTGLPPIGMIPVYVISYEPTLNSSENLAFFKRELLVKQIPKNAFVVLPGLGLFTERCAGDLDPRTSAYWAQVAILVRDSGAQAVITSVLLQKEKTCATSAAVAYITATGMTIMGDYDVDGSAPLVVNHQFGKVGIVTGDDMLLPEVPAHLGRNGVDIIIAVSTSGSEKHRQLLGTCALIQHQAWSFDELARHWVAATVNCLHVLVNDSSGQAVAAIAERECDLVREPQFFRDAARSFHISTEPVRQKIFPVLLPEERDLFLGMSTLQKASYEP